MNIGKIDCIIGIAVFIALVIFFSLQQPQLQELDYVNENKPTGGGTQTAGDNSDVMLPSGGDIPVEPEPEPEPEYVESPKTGDDGWGHLFALGLVVAMFYYVVTNKKYIGGCIQ